MAPPSKSRILIVDDEEAILETMRFTFEDEYEVFTSPDARQALEILDENAPIAAVITDQRMPNMTGVEFLAQVYTRHPNTTRMILTGFADMEAILKAINDGHVYAYITKPWEPDQLKQIVMRAVGHHKLTLENARLLTDLRRSKVLLEAVMDGLPTGALAVDPKGVVQAANQPARAFLGLKPDPRGSTLKDVLVGPQLGKVEDAIERLCEGGAERFQEVEIEQGRRSLRLRIMASTLADPAGEALGRVILLREISHEPLRRQFEEIVGQIGSAAGRLRERLEQDVAELRKLAEQIRLSPVSSADMATLADRTSRTITALENWLAVDDAMTQEAFPDAQLLMDRLRVASARWPLPEQLPARVRELTRRVEAYYESGDNPKQPIL
ncbi:MAG TPA: response regulator [Myxococcota bacterium]|nr:response regulator [Myxococcota bacterium]